MIKCIKKDPLFKKIFIMVISFMLIFSIMLMAVDYYQLKMFYKKQISVTEGLAGTFAHEYPNEEAKIMDALFKTKDNENINLGKEVFLKYGYNNELSLNRNIVLNEAYKTFMISSFIRCIFLMLMVLGIFLFIINYITKDIMSFSNVAQRIMEGDFSNEINSNKEGVFSILRTEFHQMSKRLSMGIEQLNREKDSMKSVVTEMSHQLKTPVASLKLSNSLLLENDLSSEEREEFLQKCNEDIDKLEWLVSSLIKMSRLEADIIEIDLKKSSIKNTVIKAVNGVYIKALNKNIDIDMEDLQDDTIEHDVKWTKEALINILENAVKYTKKGGRIKITTSQLPSLFKIDIEDNGIGIPEKEINNIFKKFYRGNSKEVTEADGLGVGLYLSRKIIEKQGGSIMAHSRAGTGSRFTVFLQKCYEN